MASNFLSQLIGKETGLVKERISESLAKKMAKAQKKEGKWRGLQSVLKTVANVALPGVGGAILGAAIDPIGRHFGAGARPSDIKATGDENIFGGRKGFETARGGLKDAISDYKQKNITSSIAGFAGSELGGAMLEKWGGDINPFTKGGMFSGNPMDKGVGISRMNEAGNAFADLQGTGFSMPSYNASSSIGIGSTSDVSPFSIPTSNYAEGGEVASSNPFRKSQGSKDQWWNNLVSGRKGMSNIAPNLQKSISESLNQRLPSAGKLGVGDDEMTLDRVLADTKDKGLKSNEIRRVGQVSSLKDNIEKAMATPHKSSIPQGVLDGSQWEGYQDEDLQMLRIFQAMKEGTHSIPLPQVESEDEFYDKPIGDIKETGFPSFGEWESPPLTLAMASQGMQDFDTISGQRGGGDEANILQGLFNSFKGKSYEQGGMVQKYQEGGQIQRTQPATYTGVGSQRREDKPAHSVWDTYEYDGINWKKTGTGLKTNPNLQTVTKAEMDKWRDEGRTEDVGSSYMATQGEGINDFLRTPAVAQQINQAKAGNPGAMENLVEMARQQVPEYAKMTNADIRGALKKNLTSIDLYGKGYQDVLSGTQTTLEGLQTGAQGARAKASSGAATSGIRTGGGGFRGADSISENLYAQAGEAYSGMQKGIQSEFDESFGGFETSILGISG